MLSNFKNIENNPLITTVTHCYDDPQAMRTWATELSASDHQHF